MDKEYTGTERAEANTKHWITKVPQNSIVREILIGNQWIEVEGFTIKNNTLFHCKRRYSNGGIITGPVTAIQAVNWRSIPKSNDEGE